MKKIIRAVLCFGLLFIFSNRSVEALTLPGDIIKDNFEAVPIVVTPTKILIKPIRDIDMEIMPLATKTPTPIIVTQVVTATPPTDCVNN